MKRSASILTLAFVLVSCGKEIGRIPMSSAGAAETKITVKSGEHLALWTSLDLSYTGTLEARYEVDLVEGGTTVSQAKCDPLDISTKIGSKEIEIGSHYSTSYSGKMRCEIVATKDGEATVRARLIFAESPADLAIKDMSLVIKR